MSTKVVQAKILAVRLLGAPPGRMLDHYQAQAAYFEDTGWVGLTPYLRFLALPHQQPPRVTATSMVWKNLATLFPLRAGTQIGHPTSQKSGSLGCRIGIFHPFHPYCFSVMIASFRPSHVNPRK
jgi:hypothetical protein